MMKLRILMLGIMLVTIIFSLTGCAEMATVEKSFTADEVNRIEIESNLNDIIIRAASGDQLVMSIDGQETEDFYSVEDNVLSIKVGADDGNLKISLSNKEHKPLYLDIPAGMIDSLSINSAMGNITLTGMAGSVEAEATTGKIESSLAIASEIKKGQVGTTLVGQIGENNECKITVKADMGNIKLD